MGGSGENEIRAGDIVRLRSGGPIMRVHELGGTKALCVDDADEFATIDVRMLEKIESNTREEACETLTA